MRLIILILVLLLLAANSVMAQDSALFFCGNLPEADCALLRDAVASLDELRSGSFTIEVTSDFDVPDSDEAAQMRFSVEGVATDLPSPNSPAYMLELLRDADLNITASFSIAGFPATTPDGSPPPLGIPENSSAEIRVVDGVLYVNLDSLQPALDDLEGWGSFDLHAGIESRLQQLEDRTDVIEPIASGIDVNVLVNTFDADLLREFISVTRAGDEFKTSLDFAAMYANPAYQAVLREQLLARWEQIGRGDSIIQANLDRLAEAVAQVFPEPVVMRTLTVDSENRMFSGYSWWSMWDFDILIEAALGGNDVTTWSLATTDITLEVGDQNAEIMIAAPEDAEPLTVETVTQIHVLSALSLPIND